MAQAGGNTVVMAVGASPGVGVAPSAGSPAGESATVELDGEKLSPPAAVTGVGMPMTREVRPRGGPQGGPVTFGGCSASPASRCLPMEVRRLTNVDADRPAYNFESNMRLQRPMLGHDFAILLGSMISRSAKDRLFFS